MLRSKPLTAQGAILLFFKWFFLTLFGFIAIIAIFVFWNYKFSKEEKPQDCQQQFLEYSLGDIDSRFNLKNEEILAVLEDSEKIWEESLGQDILHYNPNATFKINFVFDERQEYVQKAKEFVEEYGKLEQEYSKLENVANPTKKTKQEMNILAEKQKTLADKFSVEDEKFEKYCGGSESFEQGLYLGYSVDIYTFKDGEELEFIIAHEFGHWLGLDDNKDPSSIMDWLGGNDSRRVMEDDLEKARNFCVASEL